MRHRRSCRRATEASETLSSSRRRGGAVKGEGWKERESTRENNLTIQGPLRPSDSYHRPLRNLLPLLFLSLPPSCSLSLFPLLILSLFSSFNHPRASAALQQPPPAATTNLCYLPLPTSSLFSSLCCAGSDLAWNSTKAYQTVPPIGQCRLQYRHNKP